jgi:amino acid adenylation domain-containing protein
MNLFDSMVVFENYPFDENAVLDAGLRVREVRARETTNFPLSARVHADDRLHLHLAYDPALFDAATIRRMTTHLARLLTGLATDPDGALLDVPMLDPAELPEHNGTQAPTVSATLPGLFERQVAATPDAIAVGTLTYAELNARANRLAHRLIAQGAGPENLVALILPRSTDLVIAILAVLKSGAAYLPLDPDYPAERLAFMLSDSRAALLLTDSSCRAAVPTYAGPVLLLDGLDLAGDPLPALPPPAPASPAYVVYTSGSTGLPKGVVISHSSLSAFLQAIREHVGLTPGDAWLAITSLSFDIAALELFLPLLFGARIHVASREDAADGQRLVQLVEEQRITVMQATPATWTVLREVGWTGHEDLTILCGGEALSAELSAYLQGAAKTVWNVYGPTEVTIWATLARLRPEQRVTIGRPLATTQAVVLDSMLQPVPSGVPGELYLGGNQVADGYLHRPALTAEKFVPNPFGAPGSRLYRTGDHVRSLPDSSLEYLGRIDHQIKLRGYRIELGEIEATLEGHPEVRQAVAIVREDLPGDARLVAYVTPATVSPQNLRAHLQQTLPDYMVPSTIVPLDQFPLTPNGKLDRNALPAPDRAGHSDRSLAAPTSDLEQTISTVWQEVLGRDDIGIYDNFFDLGGHSLLLVRVNQRLSVLLAREIAIVDLFRHPTIAALAHALETPSLLTSGVGHERATRRRERNRPKVKLSPEGINAGSG